MASLKEILIATLLPAIKSVGIMELTTVLNKIRESKKAPEFEDILKSLHGSFSILLFYAKKTKTKIDDGLIQTVLEAVENVAEENDIEL